MSFTIKGSGSFASPSIYSSKPVRMSKTEKSGSVESCKATNLKKDSVEATKITKGAANSNGNIIDLLWLIKHFSIKDMIHKKKKKDHNQTDMVVDVSVREDLK
ncbi:hypothetical protein ACXGQP_11930 [Enterobacter oligotrophicus]